MKNKIEQENTSLSITKIVIMILIIIGLIVVVNKIIIEKKAIAVTAESAEVISTSNTTENIIFNESNNEKSTAISENTNNWKISNTTSENNSEQKDSLNNIENNSETKESSNITENVVQNNTQQNVASENDESKNKTKATENSDKETKNGVIYLTFDDGPSANITPKILDVLKEENVKATFFILNYSDANEKYVKREAEEGHTIGIHGYSHDYSKIYTSKDAFMENVYSLQDKIEKSTGIKSMYLRFPGGSSNTISKKYCSGIMTELTNFVVKKGFKYFDWNISAEDAAGAKNAKAVYNNVVNNLSKTRTNLVLMHDFSGAEYTAEAIKDIIEYGKKEGYTFKSINDETPMITHKVNN